MNKSGIIHSEIRKIISLIGHTQMLVIVDAGFPIPQTARHFVDLSIIRGMPDFISVVSAIQKEMVVESYIYSEEIKTANKQVYQKLCELLDGVPSEDVSHAKFKEMTENSYCIIKTGECSPYSNVILISGVDFDIHI